jgi:hypothetical protein
MEMELWERVKQNCALSFLQRARPTAWTGAAGACFVTFWYTKVALIRAAGHLTLRRCVAEGESNFNDVLFVISEKGDMLDALSSMWSRSNF